MKRFRLPLISITFTLLYFGLVGNIYRLQIQNGDYYAARAASQYRFAGFLEPSRGNIYFTDRNNNPIMTVGTKAYSVIFAVPKEIKDPELIAAGLAPILSADREKLIKTFSNSNSQYNLLVRKATDNQVDQVRNLKLKGIYIEQENLRFYPNDSLASSVLGFVAPTSDDSSLSGRYGLELYYNDLLSGAPGTFEGNRATDPVAGKDISLTLDVNIQTRAEEIMQSLVQKFSATKGMFIVEEPATGKILAMGSFPNFDPNNYSASPLDTYLNPTIQGVFEPGSVMKIATMAAGLDAGKITPDTSFFDIGSLTLNGRTIRNAHNEAYGKVTMTQVIEHSINTGAAFAERQIGPDLFYNYLVKFGFGQKTGITLPGEVSGSLGNLTSSYREINFATAAFGQGISVTPLQMINAISTVANGGTLMRPYLMADEQPLAVRRVISPSAAKLTTDMMVNAVQKAVVAQIPKFDVAGKTGTAQIPDFKRGGYTQDYIHTFVGFAPAYKPRFTILMRIDKPNAQLAGMTVVPAFRELAEFMLNYYNIPPDHIQQNTK